MTTATLDPVVAAGTTIRVATREDLPQIRRMAERFRETTAYRDFAAKGVPNLEAIFEGFCSGSIGTSRWWVAESGEDLIGMIAVVVFEHPIGGDLSANELLWWVEPEARGTRAGVRLLIQAERWARDQGADSMHMISWNDRLDRFYAAVGYHPMERVYRKSLTEGR